MTASMTFSPLHRDVQVPTATVSAVVSGTAEGSTGASRCPGVGAAVHPARTARAALPTWPSLPAGLARPPTDPHDQLVLDGLGDGELDTDLPVGAIRPVGPALSLQAPEASGSVSSRVVVVPPQRPAVVGVARLRRV